MVDEESVAAHSVHAGLEGEAGAKRLFFKDEDHLFGVERVAEVLGRCFHRVGEFKQRSQLRDGEVGDGDKIAPRETLSGVSEGSVGLNAEEAGRPGVGGRVHDERLVVHGGLEEQWFVVSGEC